MKLILHSTYDKDSIYNHSFLRFIQELKQALYWHHKQALISELTLHIGSAAVVCRRKLLQWMTIYDAITASKGNLQFHETIKKASDLFGMKQSSRQVFSKIGKDSLKLQNLLYFILKQSIKTKLCFQNCLKPQSFHHLCTGY